MADVWPWLAIAGAGALHGLSPINGWLLAAACAVHARDATQARRALYPIACGQVASMAALAWAVSRGMAVDRALMRDLACALLAAAALWIRLRSAVRSTRIGTPGRHAGIALWSFLVASAQGAGLMLVPALAPMCGAGAPAGELTVPGSLALALATVGVHTAAMMLAAGVVATGVCRGVGMKLRPRPQPSLASTSRGAPSSAAGSR